MDYVYYFIFSKISFRPWIDFYTTKDALHGFSPPEELDAHFVGVSVSLLEDIEDAASIFGEAGAGDFAFKPAGLGDVELAVKHLSSQACSQVGIPQSVISKALSFIGPHVVKLSNASFAQEIFSESCRRVRLLAVKKEFVLPTPSAHDQKTGIWSDDELIGESSLLDLMQTGFHKYNSTETALIKLTDDIRMGIGKKMATFLLLFDFSKAFDTISTSRLLVKLKSLGFSEGAFVLLSQTI